MNFSNGPNDPYRASTHTDVMELAALKKKVDLLQKVYLVLFSLSLVLIIFHRATVLWAIVLGSAVGSSMYRRNLVNKYNTILNRGAPAPLT